MDALLTSAIRPVERKPLHGRAWTVRLSRFRHAQAHEEIFVVADAILDKFVRRGVTTHINGNLGHSVTPYEA